jgi:hypothetical protein
VLDAVACSDGTRRSVLDEVRDTVRAGPLAGLRRSRFVTMLVNSYEQPVLVPQSRQV